MKRILVTLFLIVSLCGYSQESNKDLKQIVSVYSTELKLNAKETRKMASIIRSYKSKLSEKDIDSNVFNTTLKSQTLEIHKLLTKEQFASYLKLRSKHQPELNYRFN